MLGQVVYDGIEVDVLSLGDADCIVVTQWAASFPHRILIDGGCAADAEAVTDFLKTRNYTNFWAVLCTHPHNDHARELIKVVGDSSFTFHNAWMHDIRNHLSFDALRRAARADDGVKQVLELTEELHAAFRSRGLTPREPFSNLGNNSEVAAYPNMTVLGPSLRYYGEIIRDFTDVDLPVSSSIPLSSPGLYDALFALGGNARPTGLSALASLGLDLPPSSTSHYSTLAKMLANQGLFSSIPTTPPPLTGTLRNSSLQKSPSTQPFNNTSVILGVTFNGSKLMLTGDAGSAALAQVGYEWNHLMYMGVPHHGSDGNLSQHDAERFCPRFAFISAKGDSSHPSPAVVSALVKVGANVYSTHKHNHLWFWSGTVPARADYGWIEPLRGRGLPEPVIDWVALLSAANR